MRIVTLNTWKNEGDYARRLALMAKGLAELRADVICLQECFACRGADTAAGLASKLGMRAHSAPARRKLRQHGGRPVMSTSGLAMLSRAGGGRAEILGLASDPRDGQRIAQRLDLDVDGRPLRILNLHLTHLRGAKADEVRAEQLSAALAWAEAGWGGGLAVCGDLNMGRGDRGFEPLEAAAGEDLGSTLQAVAGDPNQPGRAIDHVILLQAGGLRVTCRALALRQADPAGRVPSDHAAVVVDLEAATSSPWPVGRTSAAR